MIGMEARDRGGEGQSGIAVAGRKLGTVCGEIVGESNRNAGEERTAVRAWRGAMKGSKSVLELAKQSWHSDRFL